jgi:hypothetical protein
MPQESATDSTFLPSGVAARSARGLPPAAAPDLYEADYFAERREDFALFRQHIRRG